jgi:hypothetical protein
MVAAKSVPQNNPADPFEDVLRPPLDETPAQRDTRIRAEQNAKRVSDAIDEQLRTERADLKRNRADVKILLLGQSESGKSTTLKRMCSIISFSRCLVIELATRLSLTPPMYAVQAVHTTIHSSLSSHAHLYPRIPAPPYPRSLPGRASGMAYRYLSQSHPLRPKVHTSGKHQRQCADSFSRRILDTIAMEREEELYDLLDLDSLNSDGQTSTSVTTDPEIRRIAGEKHAEYSAELVPALELEGRLIRILRQDEEEEEATRLGDGSSPGWSTPRGEYAVRTTSNWKRALSVRRSQSKRVSTSSPPWEDPSDPVHVLDKSRDAIMRLWNDQWVRRRLVERRVRLQESSGLCV